MVHRNRNWMKGLMRTRKMVSSVSDDPTALVGLTGFLDYEVYGN